MINPTHRLKKFTKDKSLENSAVIVFDIEERGWLGSGIKDKNGVEIIAFDFSPSDDQWGKFLAYARKAAKPEIKSRIKSVFVYETCSRYGAAFHISYTALIDVGFFIPKGRIDALEGEQ